MKSVIVIKDGAQHNLTNLTDTMIFVSNGSSVYVGSGVHVVAIGDDVIVRLLGDSTVLAYEGVVVHQSAGTVEGHENSRTYSAGGTVSLFGAAELTILEKSEVAVVARNTSTVNLFDRTPGSIELYDFAVLNSSSADNLSTYTVLSRSMNSSVWVGEEQYIVDGDRYVSASAPQSNTVGADQTQQAAVHASEPIVAEEPVNLAELLASTPIPEYTPTPAPDEQIDIALESETVQDHVADPVVPADLAPPIASEATPQYRPTQDPVITPPPPPPAPPAADQDTVSFAESIRTKSPVPINYPNRSVDPLRAPIEQVVAIRNGPASSAVAEATQVILEAQTKVGFATDFDATGLALADADDIEPWSRSVWFGITPGSGKPWTPEAPSVSMPDFSHLTEPGGAPKLNKVTLPDLSAHGGRRFTPPGM